MKINNINSLNFNWTNNAVLSKNAPAFESVNMLSFSKEACLGLRALAFTSAKRFGETGLNDIKKISKDASIESVGVSNAGKRHVLNSRRLLEEATAQKKEIRKRNAKIFKIIEKF